MYWFHKGRISMKEIPQRVMEKQKVKDNLKEVLSTLTPSDNHVIPKTFKSVQ